MTSFIIIALLITAAVLGLLSWPLRKNRHSVSYARQAQNIHYAKERINELDEQLKNASISATDYEALKLEIESTLADDIDIAAENDSERPVNAPKSNAVLITLVCVLIPIAASGVYYFAGTPESFALAKQTTAQPNQQQVAELLGAIEERLRSNPDDTEGWTILSRSYLSLGRYQEAKLGFKKLLELQGESAWLLTSIADASGLAANGVMSGEPMAYVNRALELDPQYPQALWMAGLGEMQQGNTEKALSLWNTLVPLLKETPQQQQELRDLIAEAKQRQNSLGLEQTGIEQKTDLNNEAPAQEQNASGIKVAVSLAPTLVEKVSPSDTVFVFAKATQGPPAPLAVKRLTVADLPASITLNDNDAMLAQFKLSLFENVSISARVAKSGNPIAQPGDFESTGVDVKNNTQETVSVVITSLVE